MQNLPFDRFYVILIALAVIKFLLNRSTLSGLLIVWLGCSLSYCFFENTLSFLPLLLYLVKDQVDCLFLFLKKMFGSFKEFLSFTGNQREQKDESLDESVRMENIRLPYQVGIGNRVPIQESAFDREGGKGKVEEKEGVFVVEIRKKHITGQGISPGLPCKQFYKGISDMEREVRENEQKTLNGFKVCIERVQSDSRQSLLDKEKNSVSKAGTSSQDQNSDFPPSLHSALEKGVDRHLPYFGISVGLLLVICKTCVVVLRKLGYTQEFVKRMTDKGWPKWLFSRISNPNPEPFPEKWLFDLLVVILVFNLIILYALLNMF